MIITISGYPGAGKSTVGKALAKKLRWAYHSTGDLMSELAMQKGTTQQELTKRAEKDKSIDKELDDRQKKLGREKDDIIIDGRLSFFFIPQSLKVFLTVDRAVGAERIFKARRPDEQENTSLQATKDSIKKRLASEKKRYKKYYNIDCYDKLHYDLVIDTSRKETADVVGEIMAEMKRRQG
ncbi:cytidylate kinase family protein [Candidatus Woesearchaeota archaeon]|nr:cytidylate kinase family protein [Candidatus Woesearchaeota archaeon]